MAALAMSAKHSDEPLSQHAVQRRNEVVRLDSHVEESANNVNDVVGVDGREYQMARQRGLNGYLRSFGVADFTDHYLVRVVTQYAAKTASEGQPLLLVDGNLRDALKLILDRVFDGDDLVFFVLDLVQRAVERGRFTRTRRPGHQHHAVRLCDELAELFQILRG